MMMKYVLRGTTLFIIMVLMSCGANKKIIGEWHFDKLKTSENVPTVLKTKHETMLKEVAKISYMKFYPKHLYETKLNNSVTKGNWEYDKKKMVIITRQEKLDGYDELILKELTEDKMVLSFIEPDGDTITIFLSKVIKE